jgi:hypothetical protein
VRRALPLLLLALAACRDPNAKRVDDPPPIPDPACGDGLLQDGEDCDQSEQGTGTCQSLGFDTGRLVCNQATCRYDTALCVRRCGNGVLDLGEACDGALGLAPCASWGFNACTDACTIDTRHCVLTAFEEGPSVDMTKGGPAVVGDLPPKGPGELVMAVPGFSRVELLPWVMTRGFDATGSRKLSFLRSPVEVELLDANGDLRTDVAAINADGAYDVMLASNTGYTLQPLDGGCAGAKFLPSDGVPGSQLVAVGCGGYDVLTGSGVTRVAAPGAVAFSQSRDGVRWADATPQLHEPDGGVASLPLAVELLRAGDLDGDGDEDLVGLGLGTGGLEYMENTGVGFAQRSSNSARPSDVRVLDLDQDGRVDAAWLSGTTLTISRNVGPFLFSNRQLTLEPGTGPVRAYAVGDVDGDQDLDVVITVPTGADSTRTQVWLNRVR